MKACIVLLPLNNINKIIASTQKEIKKQKPKKNNVHVR